VLLYYPLRGWEGRVTSFFEANPKAWRDKEETDALIRTKNCLLSIDGVSQLHIRGTHSMWIMAYSEVVRLHSRDMGPSLRTTFHSA
jgi:hypothetical protein